MQYSVEKESVKSCQSSTTNKCSQECHDQNTCRQTSTSNGIILKAAYLRLPVCPVADGQVGDDKKKDEWMIYKDGKKIHNKKIKLSFDEIYMGT